MTDIYSKVLLFDQQEGLRVQEEELDLISTNESEALVLIPLHSHTPSFLIFPNLKNPVTEAASQDNIQTLWG
ncbi:hypothetical protein BLD44_006880 [Mastigocladus laminosus UU774]|nr:hypothetical protein BLD44_006880 [Mastigocladus laminosus UU774]